MRKNENKQKRRKIKGEKVGTKKLRLIERKIEKQPVVEPGSILVTAKTEGEECLGGGREKRKEALKQFFQGLKRQTAKRREEVQKLLQGIRLQRAQRKGSISETRV